MNRRRFALLDRDGTILVKRNYLANPAQVQLLPGAAAGLRQLSALGLGLVVVTNQSGIGRGYFDRQALLDIHRRMNQLLQAEGVRLDAIFYCPHHPEDGCPCRKPGTALALRAASDLNFAVAESFVIGDNVRDVEMGHRLGAATVLVRTGEGADVEARGLARADDHVDDLCEAALAVREAMLWGAQTSGTASAAGAPAKSAGSSAQPWMHEDSADSLRSLAVPLTPSTNQPAPSVAPAA